MFFALPWRAPCRLRQGFKGSRGARAGPDAGWAAALRGGGLVRRVGIRVARGVAMAREIAAGFAEPAFRDVSTEGFEARAVDPGFRALSDTNLGTHKAPGHAIVTILLKAPGATLRRTKCG